LYYQQATGHKFNNNNKGNPSENWCLYRIGLRSPRPWVIIIASATSHPPYMTKTATSSSGLAYQNTHFLKLQQTQQGAHKKPMIGQWHASCSFFKTWGWPLECSLMVLKLVFNPRLPCIFCLFVSKLGQQGFPVVMIELAGQICYWWTSYRLGPIL
jgi:hypothetical protein